jgi:hypothetical protein
MRDGPSHGGLADGMRGVLPDRLALDGQALDGVAGDALSAADLWPDGGMWPSGEMWPEGSDGVAGIDWPPDTAPPDALPVMLWSEETLRAALAGLPGARLARILAEATGLGAGLATTSIDGGVDGVVDELLLGDLSDDALGDLVVAAGRLQSWTAGLQARIVAERARRESHPLAHSSLVGQVTGERGSMPHRRSGTRRARGPQGVRHSPCRDARFRRAPNDDRWRASTR